MRRRGQGSGGLYSAAKKEQFYRKIGKYNFEQQQRHNDEDELRQSPGMEERKKENLSKTDSHLFGNYKSDVIFCK